MNTPVVWDEVVSRSLGGILVDGVAKSGFRVRRDSRSKRLGNKSESIVDSQQLEDGEWVEYNLCEE